MRNLLRLILLPILMVIAGCSSSQDKSAPVEIEAASLKVSAEDQDRLWKDAREAYENELYSIAVERFEKLRNSYPVGPYAEAAELKIADSIFQQGQYASAAQRYQAFLKDHPSTASAEYVLVMAARSFQLSNRGAGKDPSALQQALNLYDQGLRDFPAGVYREAAAVYRQEVMLVLAEHERTVLDFYKRREMIPAYEERVKEFNWKWASLIADGRIPPAQ